MLHKKRELELHEKQGEDEYEAPPAPALHTFPWVVMTETKASAGKGRSDRSSSTALDAPQKSPAIDWRGWHRHYSVYLYRLGPVSWSDDGGQECRGLDLEWEGFATCSSDPLHRMALEMAAATDSEGTQTESGKGGKRLSATMGGSTAPRNTPLFYRIVRQTSGEDLPYPGEVVQQSLIERDEDDGLKYSVRMHKNAALWKVGDRLQVWVKAVGVAPEENTRIYTRNFMLTFPINKWLRDKAKKRGGGHGDVSTHAGASQVLADQTFHRDSSPIQKPADCRSTLRKLVSCCPL